MTRSYDYRRPIRSVPPPRSDILARHRYFFHSLAAAPRALQSAPAMTPRARRPSATAPREFFDPADGCFYYVVRADDMRPAAWWRCRRAHNYRRPTTPFRPPTRPPLTTSAQHQYFQQAATPFRSPPLPPATTSAQHQYFQQAATPFRPPPPPLPPATTVAQMLYFQQTPQVRTEVGLFTAR